MALSGEEKTLLSNIAQLAQQMLQIENGEDASETEDPNTADMAQDDKTDPDAAAEEDPKDPNEDEEGVEKADGSDGATASDDADSRLEDDLPTITEEGLQAIKSLIKKGVLSVNKKQVAKNGDTKVLMKAVSQLTTVVKSLVQDQNEMQKAMGSLIEGLGIANEIKKSLPTPAANSRVAKSADVNSEVFKQDILDGVARLVGAPSGNVQNSAPVDVRKSLTEALPFMIVQK